MCLHLMHGQLHSRQPSLHCHTGHCTGCRPERFADCSDNNRRVVPRPHLLPGGPNAADGSITSRARGFLRAGGSNDRAASARCAARKYRVWSASQFEGYLNSVCRNARTAEGQAVSTPCAAAGCVQQQPCVAVPPLLTPRHTKAVMLPRAQVSGNQHHGELLLTKAVSCVVTAFEPLDGHHYVGPQRCC